MSPKGETTSEGRPSAGEGEGCDIILLIEIGIVANGNGLDGGSAIELGGVIKGDKFDVGDMLVELASNILWWTSRLQIIYWGLLCQNITSCGRYKIAG